MNAIKKLAKKALAMFGIGIYRLESSQPLTAVAQGFIITSPIEANTEESDDKYYSDPEIVKAYLEPERLEFYEYVVNFLHENGVDFNGKTVADLGCGTGHLLLNIHKKFTPKSLTGMDHSKFGLDVGRSILPNATFQYFDIYQKYDFQFEVIFCTEVLEHLLYPEQALKNMITIISTCGVMLLTVPNGRTDTFLGHINFWSPESWDVFVKSVCNDLDIELEINTGLTTKNSNFAILKRNN
ncbi:MAG: hypothetical protein DCF20_10805 [Pseudanabaena sp.]|nr:MAG: hypothetical protein DCF20_10805 [Pseudanabaena sp.]